MKIKRDGLEKKYNITLQKNPTKSYVIEALPNQNKEQLELYKRWLYLP